MEYIHYQTENRIAYITLARAEKRNALNEQMVSELKQAFGQAADDAAVKVIVLKAEGQAFCAGADLAYLQQLQKNTFEENLDDSRHLKELFHQIYTHPKVVIAQIQGHALAGGCGLATVCDFSFTVPEAKFGYTEVRIGFIPAIVKVFLLRKIGEGKAKELLLTGELISAEKAVQMGLITYLSSADTLEQEVNAFAAKLVAANSGQAMSTTKQMIARVQEMSLEEALEFAAESNAHARATADCQKGIAAFLNKEPVVW
ncbi:enoyl-CoA hydratase-related protein [Cytophagales bacterium LB-30]|uniref:Enoyl-CoA hydratase-related protein n=1 Tax=Shiella aurantiaca TaxID=3058365 RepID=A0ABT8F1J4_9BACT|nr:enoyl-CoA hydratase-related protein [Shiella aurantiaca]MDN4164297.1 enoyl-CoA hydratase-related protein [Shiella aurantiaca]